MQNENFRNVNERSIIRFRWLKHSFSFKIIINLNIEDFKNNFYIFRKSLFNNLNNHFTVKLSEVKRFSNRSETHRIKYEFATANRTRTFLLFLCFFCKKFDSIEPNSKMNWIWCIQVMKILNYVQLIDSVRSNRTEIFTKKHKNDQKIRKSTGTVSLIEFSTYFYES